MGKENEKSCQNGHSDSSKAENLSSELKIIGGTDYSKRAAVYKIRGARTSGAPLHVDIGEATRLLINESVKLAYMMDECATPLPLELVINEAGKTVFCGKKLEIARDVSETVLGTRIEDIMSEHGVSFVAIMRDGWFPFVYVSFGRGDEAEFFASVYFPNKEVD